MDLKSWQFKKGNRPPSHKEGCGCFRCDPINGKRGKSTGFHGKHTQETKDKISLKKMGQKHSTKSRLKTSDSMKKLPQAWFKSNLQRRGMSKLEKRVQSVIDDNRLPYKFVGNGDFMIERKCPDFVNTNGKKIAVEVYWKRHKDQFKDGGEQAWKNERQELFSKYGWETLFIEGTTLTNNTIVETLK